MQTEFKPFHRGGSGEPLLLLHGFTDTWRTWDLVRPELEKHHDVLAITLPGHAGGPALEEPVVQDKIIDQVEAMLDEAGIETAHIVGNSLGGYLSLRLAARGRARSVVALAPAGGWAEGDESFKETVGFLADMKTQLEGAAQHIDALIATPEGRRLATQFLTTNYEHIPAELIGHQIMGVIRCDGAMPLVQSAVEEGWSLNAERVSCPVRLVWGTEDRILEMNVASPRFRNDWLPQAEWVELDGIGHCPQLDVPTETTQLILGHTSG
ncbi:MAG: alpha/beta fold hydrolase [Solirubrobacterales bacterium]